MIINWTNAFKVLRDTKIKERLMRTSLTFEYLARQSKSMSCSLCYKLMDINDLLCEGCFHKLHPPPIDFKISIAVECAKVLRRIRGNETKPSEPPSEDEIKLLQLLDIPENCSLRDLAEKIFSLKSTQLSCGERLILSNIKLKIQAETANKWTAVRIKTMMDLLDEQLNIVKLKYLVCLRNLRFDDVLLLKKHIVEIRKHKDCLAEMLGNRSIT
ncbi:hypothetical protein KMI_01g00140 [Encephalitozoon hellem]|nr:hypothetical protein KMI_01g00140 [Encephalitozoon hellem]